MIRSTAPLIAALGLALGLSFACASTGSEVADGVVTAEPVIPEGDLGLLVEDLLYGNPEERARAIEDIAGLGTDGQLATDFLVGVVHNDQPDLQIAAADALVRIDADPERAVPALAEGLEDEDETVIGASAKALGLFGAAAVDALVSALESTNPVARWNAALALGAIGTDAADAIPSLVRALGDPDEQVRARVARALGMIATESTQAVQPLVSALDDEDATVRAAAAWSVGEHGEHARWAVLPLVDALRDEDPGVRMHAAIALGKLGEHARQAVLDLSSLLESETDLEVRRAATEALIKTRD